MTVCRSASLHRRARLKVVVVFRQASRRGQQHHRGGDQHRDDEHHALDSLPARGAAVPERHDEYGRRDDRRRHRDTEHLDAEVHAALEHHRGARGERTRR